MIDDLITRGTSEPYRMFTSRAEYRLLLREDNADLRLREPGRNIGLVNDRDFERYLVKKTKMEELLDRLDKQRVNPTAETNDTLRTIGSVPINNPASLKELLRRPEMSLSSLAVFDPALDSVEKEVAEQVEIQIKYEGYVRRQEEQVMKFKKAEASPIPETMNYSGIPGLSNELKEKLSRVTPRSIGQASRIQGMTPAALSILQIYTKRNQMEAHKTSGGRYGV
jgi:tRNA uridine 5-carboxymethylaminomethyl modification enzyme